MEARVNVGVNVNNGSNSSNSSSSRKGKGAGLSGSSSSTSTSASADGSINSNSGSSNKFLLLLLNFMSSDTGFRLAGNFPIVEITHSAAASPAATTDLVTGCSTATTPSASEFRPGMCYYRGLFFKYHKLVINPDIEPSLLEQHQEIIDQTTKQARLLATLAAKPLTTQTSDVIERLTGLLLQAGVLTLKQLHEVIIAGSFYPPEPAPASGVLAASQANCETEATAKIAFTFTPRPELLDSVEKLLAIEALPLEQKVNTLAQLPDREWARYLMIAKARNRALLNVLIENPGLIGDARVRYSYMVRLQFTLPAYLMTAHSYRGIQLEKQAWSELETEATTG